MSESHLLFLDANTLASPVTRTLLIAGARADGLRWTWSKHVEVEAVDLLAAVQQNPPRAAAEIHRMLGRRHPRLVARFSNAYDTAPVPADPDQPSVLFRGVACVRCGAGIGDPAGLRHGMCADHPAL